MWFGMTTGGVLDFREVKARTESRGAAHLRNKEEVRRRVECFNAAVKAAGIARVIVPERPGEGLVLHFAVIAARRVLRLDPLSATTGVGVRV